MIKATFIYSKNGAPLGFEFKGHSGYAESGSDIICASVSSAALLVANTITDIMFIEAAATMDDDGYLKFTIQEKDAEKTKDILLGLELHIKELSQQYPKHVTITTTEV